GLLVAVVVSELRDQPRGHNDKLRWVRVWPGFRGPTTPGRAELRPAAALPAGRGRGGRRAHGSTDGPRCGVPALPRRAVDPLRLAQG
ncbi:MAG: hypothetical protein L0I76_37480, partial [Pseudonocardia sp.]|nr:hypothetical protein [Pseudonocardia sp.]